MVLNPIFLGGVWFIIHRYSVFHTFIWRGWVGGPRNPFKALSIHVNHNEYVFLRTSSSFRVSRYQIVLSAQDVFYRALPNLVQQL
jgi:hypothetical protein